MSESDRDFEKYEKLKDNYDWFHSNYQKKIVVAAIMGKEKERKTYSSVNF